MMRDVLATHRDIGALGLRHRTWLRVVSGVALLFLLLWLRSSWSAPATGVHDLPSNVDRFHLALMSERKSVAVVVPLFGDHAALLKKRFTAWNKNRSPCLKADDTRSSVDLVFYVGSTGLPENKAAIEAHLSGSAASQCFQSVRFISAPPLPVSSSEKAETYAFYRLFTLSGFADKYDSFFWMDPAVWQVRRGWLNKVYEQAVLSDPFWVRGSSAMQTCPASALSADGDCDGSINHAFPSVLHININALYKLRADEFASLLTHAEQRHPNISPDVALYKELVSSDHPLTSKLARGMRRKLHSVEATIEPHVRHHEEDPAVSVARSKEGHHLTSLYWAAHAHRYQYADFIVNAVAGKKHLMAELKKGSHTSTFFVNEHLSS